MSHSPNMFLGVGTGRNGTLSLAKILDEAEGVSVQHESFPIVKGKASATVGAPPLDVQGMLARFGYGSTWLIGHVGALWTGFVPILRLQFPFLPVICLHREKSKVIDSFLRVQATRKRPWMINVAGVTDTVSREYLEFHWDWCERMMACIPEPVLHVELDELNSDAGLDRIYDFLLVENDCRAYPDKRVWHQRGAALDGKGSEYVKVAV